jgi:hypothetical protein
MISNAHLDRHTYICPSQLLNIYDFNPISLLTILTYPSNIHHRKPIQKQGD